MTCREFAAFLDDYVAGSLHMDVQHRFEEHITVCPNCVRYLAQYRDAIAFGRSSWDHPDSAVPVDVPDDLVAAIMTARASVPAAD